MHCLRVGICGGTHWQAGGRGSVPPCTRWEVGGCAHPAVREAAGVGVGGSARTCTRRGRGERLPQCALPPKLVLPGEEDARARLERCAYAPPPGAIKA